MKIDSHQHFWHYNATEYGWINDEMAVLRNDFLPVQLVKELTTIGFDGSIAVQARQSLEETNWLLQLADLHPFIKGVVGWIDLQSEQAEMEIAHFAKHPKAAGVRHVIHDEADVNFMLQPSFMGGMKMLEPYQLTYDLLIFPIHLDATIQFIPHFSEQQIFVIDHIAKPLIREGILSPWKEKMTLLASYPNVFCKVSGMVTEANWQMWRTEDIRPYLDVVFETFGTERVMIGSDWPVCLLAGNYGEVMAIVTDYIAEFSESEKAMILGGNACRAYLSRKQ